MRNNRLLLGLPAARVRITMLSAEAAMKNAETGRPVYFF
jgi:hypothetical protein